MIPNECPVAVTGFEPTQALKINKHVVFALPWSLVWGVVFGMRWVCKEK